MEIRTFLEPIAWWQGEEDDWYIDWLLEYFYKMQKEDPEGDHASARLGWQRHHLHMDDKFRNDDQIRFLNEFLLNKFHEYLRAFETTVSYYATLNSLFVNILPPGGYNVTHIHPGCQFSGVFYLKGGEHCGNLTLYNPMAVSALAENFIGFPKVESMMTFPPERNKGLFFTSGIQHNVDINRSDHDRVSIAFNIRINDFAPSQ